MGEVKKTVKQQILDLRVGSEILFPIEKLLYLTSLCSSLGAITGNKYRTARRRDLKKVVVKRMK